ncbi:MAG: hypothetical protein D6689_08445 [Deltaproteobacteria bacterium]|nr:MAG: hypothetical protein D6689_08445 [Deltaproteobacteria bacterium]
MKLFHAVFIPIALQVGAGCLSPEVALDGESLGDEAEASTVAPSSSQLATLYTWYSPSRRDYFTTTQAAWAGSPGDTRSPDYQFVRVEGRVWRPDGPQPLDTTPLYLWWNGARRDNVLVAGTSSDGWLTRAGYRRVRLEGYAADTPLAGTVALDFVYSSDDYAATADPTWDEAGYRRWRTLGYIFPPGFWMETTPEPEAFGYNRNPVEGTRPLLVIVRTASAIVPATSQGAAFYRQLVFGPGPKTIPGFFRANSYGKFTFAQAGVVQVVTPTANDASAIQAAAAAGFAFDRYDRNGDGTVTSDELTVVVVNKDGQGCGQTRPVSCVRPAGASANVCLSSVSFVGELANLTTIAHEIAHQLTMWDIYGPGARWNAAASTAAATCTGSNDTRSFQFDAWHKMHWGWIRPRVVAIGQPATVETLYTPGAFGTYGYEGKRPVILFDPARGTREFFVLEARSTDGAYDSDVADDGMAVWLVNLKADLSPADIRFQADSDPAIEHIFGVRLFHGPDRDGNTGPRAGTGRFFRPGDGALALRWSDGTTAVDAVAFAWQGASRTVGFVQIGGDATFRARIDAPRLVATRGAPLYIPGVFGLEGARVVELADAASLGGTLAVRQWLPEGGITVDIPAGLAPGDYTLRVRGAGAGTESNRAEVHVR